MADNVKTIKLGMNYSEFTEGVNSCNAKLKLLENAYKLNKEQLKGYGSESDKVKNDIEYLTEKIKLQSEKVEECRKAYEKAQATDGVTEAQLARLNSSYMRSQTELARLENSLNSADEELASMNTDMQEQESAFLKNEESALAYSEALSLIQQGLGKVKEGMMDYLSLDSNMAKINTIADTTKVSLEELKQGVYDISDATGKSAEDISNAMYEAISSGVETSEVLEFMTSAAKNAKAGFTETATSVDVLTTILNAYGMSASEAKKISDELIITQNIGKTTVDEMGSAFGKVAGLASQLNVPIEQLLAGVATITQTGTGASESINGMRAAMSNIIKPSKEAKETAKQLGIEFNATALQSKGLAGFMEDVKEKTGGNVETMAKLFGSVEAVNTMLLLTGDVGSKRYIEALNELTTANGTTEEALEKMNGTSGRFNSSLNKLQNALIKLGDALSPIIDFFTGLINIIANIPTPLLVVITVLGTLTLIINSVAKAQALWTSVQAICSIAMGVFTGASELTTLSLGKLLIVILAIVAVLALLIGGWQAVKKSMEDVKNVGNSLTSATASANTSTAQARQATSGIVSYNASGTDDFQGGYTWVGENGAEKVFLPRHSRIVSTEDSNRSTGDTYYNVTIDAKSVKEFVDIMNICKNARIEGRMGANAL